MSLRIFEPRYTRMVKEACKSDTGFVICMLNSKGNKEENTHIFPTGTYCKVIDFDILEDGLLGITVEGIRCVAISNIETADDGLRVADCDDIDVWSSNIDIDIDLLAPMNARLGEIFNTFIELSSLYEDLRFDDPRWVINRWLELLPVDAEQKQYFLSQKDSSQVVNYLTELIE